VSLGPQAGDELQRVAAALQANEGREVEALFLRQGAPVALKLTPQRWSGRGLLGCHLRPMGRQ
jgi:26S proteasome non-ATPase regulatory subunit 9